MGYYLKSNDISICQEKFSNSRVVGSENIKADDLKVSNIGQNNLMKMIENIALHLKHVRGLLRELCWSM